MASLPPAKKDVEKEPVDDDAASSAGSDVGGGDLFADPPDYYPATPPPTTEQHALGRSGVQLTLHLVGHSVLEAHRLWNGSRVLSDYLEATQEETDPNVVRGKTVLELGAGAGLPSIVCGLVLGASRVVVTDYPDPDLVATMQKNVDAAAKSNRRTDPPLTEVVIADGLVWGADPTRVLAHIKDVPPAAATTGSAGGGDASKRRLFDVVLLADLLFRHAEHAKLARSVAETLEPGPDSAAYVFFTSYRPWLRHKDLAFFEHAVSSGLVVEHLLEKRLEKPPLFFENDPGAVSVRSTVSGYRLRWPVAGEDPKTFWPPPGGIDVFDLPEEDGAETK